MDEHVTIESDIPEEVDVLANALLPEVFGNVLNNAVEHNDDDDLYLTVAVEETSETVTVTVADDGTGIDDARKDVIFERGETSGGGTGFGLFFVESMVDVYDATVEVGDNEPTGAVFEFEFQAG